MTPEQRKAMEAALEVLNDARKFVEDEHDNRYQAIVDDEYSRAPSVLIVRIDATLAALTAALEGEGWRPIESAPLVGTFSCPICGRDTPHHHPDDQVNAWREDNRRNDGWISTAHKEPEIAGWYLCSDIIIELEQFGAHGSSLWRQLSWMLWVRAAGGAAAPEVLYYDRNAPPFGWRLRTFLGNADASGADTRKPVACAPRYWRYLPTPPPPQGEK